jgi:hypothetical protein
MGSSFETFKTSFSSPQVEPVGFAKDASTPIGVGAFPFSRLSTTNYAEKRIQYNELRGETN